MRKQRSFKWLGRAPAVALTILALASTCAAADAVKVTADGQIEYAGRFVGGKGADCDVGSLSRIVMHLGSGIAIRQGLLRQDAELDALVERMRSDRPDADAAADAVSRRIEAAVHESTAAYLARQLFIALKGHFFAWWSCLPQQDPRYMRGSDGIVMPLEAFARFAQLIVCDGEWKGRRHVPKDWFVKHPITEFRRGGDWLKIDLQKGYAEFSFAPRPVRSNERMNARDSLGATKYQCLLLEPKGNVRRRAIADSIHLPDGRLLVVYDRMTGYGDDAYSDMCSIYSSDNGKTWSEEVKLFSTPKGSMNMAGPSLINLRSGDLGLMHLHKRNHKDCRPVFRRSKDGGKTWTEPKDIISKVAYHAPANGMLSRDSRGRIHYPVDCAASAFVMDCFSDDDGETWKYSSPIPFGKKPNRDRLRLEEPNVFERKDGTLVMSMRTNADYIYFAESKDGGETWGEIYPTTLRSPRHPAKIIRIPDGRLAATWIDHEGRPEQMFKMPYHRGTRAPYTVGLSSDEGRTWTKRMILEPTGWNSNGGMHYHDGSLYINYGMDDFNSTRLVKVPIADFSDF